MTAPYNPNIDLEVSRGAGLYLQINGRPVDNTYGTIVMAELAALREEFPAVRVDVHLHGQLAPLQPRWHVSSPPSWTETRSGTKHQARRPRAAPEIAARENKSWRASGHVRDTSHLPSRCPRHPRHATCRGRPPPPAAATGSRARARRRARGGNGSSRRQRGRRGGGRRLHAGLFVSKPANKQASRRAFNPACQLVC